MLRWIYWMVCARSRVFCDRAQHGGFVVVVSPQSASKDPCMLPCRSGDSRNSVDRRLLYFDAKMLCMKVMISKDTLLYQLKR